MVVRMPGPKKKTRGGVRLGAGRPPIKAGRVLVRIRIDPKVLAGIDEVVKERGTDRSRILEEAALEWLMRLPDCISRPAT